MNIDDIVWVDFVVECEQENCDNSGAQIIVTAPETPHIICGVCGQQIDKFSKITDPETV